MPGLLASLLSCFGCGKSGPEGQEVTDTYRDRRQKLLNLNPSLIGLAPSKSKPVWGLLTETGDPEAVMTLVTIADGSVSLYFSNGRVQMGLGEHDGPFQACQALLAAAPAYLEHAEATAEYPLPAEGETRFYFLTFDGILSAEAQEADLENGQHALSPLFQKVDDVITQARLVDEQARGQ